MAAGCQFGISVITSTQNAREIIIKYIYLQTKEMSLRFNRVTEAHHDIQTYIMVAENIRGTTEYEMYLTDGEHNITIVRLHRHYIEQWEMNWRSNVFSVNAMLC